VTRYKDATIYFRRRPWRIRSAIPPMTSKGPGKMCTELRLTATCQTISRMAMNAMGRRRTDRFNGLDEFNDRLLRWAIVENVYNEVRRSCGESRKQRGLQSSGVLEDPDSGAGVNQNLSRILEQFWNSVPDYSSGWPVEWCQKSRHKVKGTNTSNGVRNGFVPSCIWAALLGP
jgi:hypothetical protein